MSLLHDSPFLEQLLRFLIPYFTDVTPDLATARAEALETLAAYGARTRAELLCAAQTIAFSLAALDTLTEAKATDMSQSMRIRHRSCANNLNRNYQKTEAILAKRLTQEVPKPTPHPEPAANDLTENDAQQILQQTQAHIRAPTPKGQKSSVDVNKQLWGAAMMETLAEMGMPVQPAEAR